MSGAMQQPGAQAALSSADSATEVVSGTMTNSAASLEADYQRLLGAYQTDIGSKRTPI